jgi:virulence factor
MKTIPIGIIGSGYIANKAYFPLLTTLPDISINKVINRSTKNWDALQSSWPSLTLTTSWNEFFDSDLEAAFVLTQAETHYEICSELLDQGLHVFVEKPPTTSSEKTRALAQKANHKKLVFMVGFNRRFSTPIQIASKRIRQDEIRLCIFEKHRPSRQKRGLTETYLEDLIHQVDLLRLFCGDSIPLQTAVNEIDGSIISLISSLKTKFQGLGIILHSRESGRWQERVTITGNEKTLLIDLFQSVTEVTPDGTNQIWKANPDNTWLDDRGFQEEIVHFFDCIRKKNKPHTDGYEAAKTQELQEKIVSQHRS